MKILEIDYDYYYYPQDISCIEDFIEYVNGHYNSFVKLTRFETKTVFSRISLEKKQKKFMLMLQLLKK